MPVNREFFESMFSVIDRSEWDMLSKAFAPDACYARPGYADFVGLDAIHTFYVRDRIIACGKHTIEACVVDGEAASCWGIFEGLGKNGAPLAERFADVYQLRQGRILHRRTHFFRPAV